MELWNVHEGVTAVVGAQYRFNIVGRVDDPGNTLALSCRLNGGDWSPVAVNLSGGPKARLRSPGDFNIDAFKVEELLSDNVIEVRQTRRGLPEVRRVVAFGASQPPLAEPDFELSLGNGKAEEYCQVVDGHWRVVHDGQGPALVIDPADAGYDRIALFGHRQWTTGYEVDACISVDRWTNYVHNVGVLFKWNPHRLGRAGRLPTEWTTGLAYYASTSPGLRVRFGDDVRFDDEGRKLGDQVLAERPVNGWGTLPRWLLRGTWHLSGRRLVLSQLRPGVPYRYRVRVDPAAYSLSVWRAGRPEPRPQIVVVGPTEVLASGSVGVIAQNAAARVHSFRVRSLGSGNCSDVSNVPDARSSTGGYQSS